MTLEYSAPGAPSQVLFCSELAPFAVRVLDTRLRVELPLRDVELPQVEAASGARYADAAMMVWLKGEEALYSGPGDEQPHRCRAVAAGDPWQQAALRGVTFRAIGQEPGWLLEIVPARHVRVLADYGEVRVMMPPAAPVQQGERQAWSLRTEAHSLLLEVEPGECIDGMSGESFGQRVLMVLDGTSYRGCGRTLD